MGGYKWVVRRVTIVIKTHIRGLMARPGTAQETPSIWALTSRKLPVTALRGCVGLDRVGLYWYGSGMQAFRGVEMIQI